MHNIEHRDYPENCDKKDVQSALNSFVEHETWREGGGGIDNIRWLDDVVCDSYEEAEKYLKEHDKGWYDCLAVRYKELLPGSCNTPKAKELHAKTEALMRAYCEKADQLYSRMRTSEFVVCRNCKSKLSSKYLTTNFCPVCKQDIRPETLLNTIAAAKKRMQKAFFAEKEYVQKHSETTVRWLVKIEYHT